MSAIPPVNQYPNPTTEINQWVSGWLNSQVQSSSSGYSVQLTSSAPSYNSSTIYTNNPTLYSDYMISTYL